MAVGFDLGFFVWGGGVGSERRRGHWEVLGSNVCYH